MVLVRMDQGDLPSTLENFSSFCFAEPDATIDIIFDQEFIPFVRSKTNQTNFKVTKLSILDIGFKKYIVVFNQVIIKDFRSFICSEFVDYFFLFFIYFFAVFLKNE